MTREFRSRSFSSGRQSFNILIPEINDRLVYAGGPADLGKNSLGHARPCFREIPATAFYRVRRSTPALFFSKRHHYTRRSYV